MEVILMSNHNMFQYSFYLKQGLFHIFKTCNEASMNNTDWKEN